MYCRNENRTQNGRSFNCTRVKLWATRLTKSNRNSNFHSIKMLPRNRKKKKSRKTVNQRSTKASMTVKP